MNFENFSNFLFGPSSPTNENLIQSSLAPNCTCGQKQTQEAKYLCLSHYAYGTKVRQKLTFAYQCAACNNLVSLWTWTDLYDNQIMAPCQHQP